MSGQTIQIISTPDIRGGRPRIDGHRITVAEIAMAYEGAHGHWNVDQIAQEFDLTSGEIHTALAYYYEHQEEIDRSIREDHLRAEKQIKAMPSVHEGVAGKLADLRAKAQKKRSA